MVTQAPVYYKMIEVKYQEVHIIGNSDVFSLNATGARNVVLANLRMKSFSIICK